jgi:hypothetical protein
MIICHFRLMSMTRIILAKTRPISYICFMCVNAPSVLVCSAYICLDIVKQTIHEMLVCSGVHLQ